MRRAAVLTWLIPGLLPSALVISLVLAISASAGTLWVAESRGTLRFDALDGAFVLAIPEAPAGTGAVAIDPTNGNVWTWGEQRLRGFDRDGVNFLDVESQSYPLWDFPNDLLVDGESANLWLNLGNDLFRLNLSGEVTGSLLNYGATCNSMTLDRARSRLWLCTFDSIKAYDATFQEIVSLQLLSSDTPCHSAWDDFRDELWVAVNDKLRRYDSNGQLTFEMPNPAGMLNTYHLIPDGRGGVWLGTETQMLYIDPTGAAGSWITPFADFTYQVFRDAVVHPIDASLWVGNETSLRRFSTLGAQVQSRLLDIGDNLDHYLQNMVLFEDQSAPIIEFSAPPNNGATNQTRPTVRLVFLDAGSGIDDETLMLSINEAPLVATCTIEELGAECVPDAPLSDGVKIVTARISDTSGNESDPATVRFTLDTVSPEISVSSPAAGAVTNQQNIMIMGSVSEPTTLRINGTLVTLDGNNSFSFMTALQEGPNTLSLVATDNATNGAILNLSVTRDTEAPNAPNVGFVSVSAPAVGTVTVTGQAQSVEANALVTLTNLRTGQSVSVVATGTGEFVVQISAEESDQLQIRATDSALNPSNPAQVTVPGNLPPDPSTVATPLTTTSITPFGESTAFLYSGPNPIQTGVAPGTIQRDFAAVIRGTVTTRTGQALPNVVVSINDRAEFGQTRTRADGQFDLAVNGSSSVVINYERAGYLSVQRRLDVRPNDYVTLDNVVLVQPDATVTPIAFGSSATQVHRSTLGEDADGMRRTTVMVLPGTIATMRFLDGSNQNLVAGQLRATEFSIGVDGRQAMPGELPPTSAYTFAVELSIDEAMQAGASRVDFSRRVPVYIENFLEGPVGQVVPVGSYDRQLAAWVPEDNGLIIRILAIEQGGLATLDVDGSGDPATPQQLLQLNISDQERGQLANLYAPQATLWRFEATHFTPWDCNWPYGLPADFQSPPVIDSDIESPDHEQGVECEGCRIDAQSQALQQDVRLTGVPFELNYRSDRQRRRSTIDVPITGSQVPSSLLFVSATASIAGKVVRSVQAGNLLSGQLQAPQPNQRLTYEWDGRDAYGRSIHGSVPVTIDISHYYRVVFLSAGQIPENVVPLPRGFGEFTTDGAAVMSAAVNAPNLPPELRASRLAVTRRTVTQVLSSADPAPNQIGGWTLSPHHSFDPFTRALSFGDGRKSTIATDPLSIQSVPSEVDRYGAGTAASQFGTIRGVDFMRGGNANRTGVLELCFGDADNRRIYCGYTSEDYGSPLQVVAGGGSAASIDGANPLTVALDAPSDVAVLGDTAVYFTSSNANRLWKTVRTESSQPWVLRHVAGTGVSASTGDGGLAVNAAVNQPTSIAVSEDGTIFFTEAAGHRVRKISADGRISSLAGTGVAGFSGDNGLARDAQLSSPAGIALGPDGSLFVADQGNRRIRRIDGTGRISTYAGNGASCVNGTDPCGDGAGALSAQFSAPVDVAAFTDGRIMIADAGARRVRLVKTNGTIIAYAGNGLPAWGDTPSGEFGPPGTAGLSETLSISATGHRKGSLLIGDRNFLRFVEPPGASFVTDETLGIPSESGDEIFVFSPAGLHLETLDAVSRVRLVRFTYDAQGRLSSLIDKDGNATQIERTPSGAPEAIVSPYGQRTALSRDANGFVARIENPAGDAYEATYTPEGWMTRFRDPRQNESSYAYESDGRLRSDLDAAGGGWTLARLSVPIGIAGTGATVDMTSGEGRTTRVAWTADGSEYATTFPDGTVERRLLRISTNEDEIQRTDGLQISSSIEFDRYFWPLEVKEGSIRNRRPSGTESNVEFLRTYTATENAPDPLEPAIGLVATRTTVLSRNDNQWTTFKNRVTRNEIATSPEGREVRTIFDTLWRPQTIIRPEMANEVRQYDGRGRLSQQTLGSGATARSIIYSYYQSGPQAGALESVTDPEGRATLFEYDPAGRPIRTTLPGGRTVEFAYDASGNLTALTPPGRPSHVLSYSPVNQTSSYTPPAIGLATPATLYAYNLDQQLVQVTRPDSQQLTFNYNTVGKLETAISPRGTTTYSYNAVSGQLSGIQDPSGQSVAFAYDGSFPTSTTWSGPVSGTVGISYNADSWISGVSVDGQDIDFAFDRDGLVTRAGELQISRAASDGRESDTLLGVVATNAAYNEFGEVTTFQASRPTGAQDNVAAQIRSEIDQLGATLNSIWTDCEIDFAQAEYNTLVGAAQGLPANTQAYDAAFSQFSLEYENSLRPNALFECGLDDLVAQADASIGTIQGLRQDLGGGGSVPQTIFSQEHVRDRLGRITQTTERIEGIEIVRSFGYDTAGRLTQVTVNSSAVETYTYDDNGNRLTASGVTSTYDDQDRLLTSGQATYAYTANGELLSKMQAGQTTAYSYDLLGNLMSAQLPDGRVISYVVDGLKRRVGKRVNGTLVQGFLYQGQLQLAAELSGSGAVVSRFVYGTRPNVPDYMIRDGVNYRIVSDYLGSPRLVFNAATGEVVQRINYDAFGNVTADTNPGFQPFGFAGGIYDRDTGLVRFGARDYDPEVGRWTAKDPILFEGGDTSLYAYVGNDPIRWIDPTGLSGYDMLATFTEISHSPASIIARSTPYLGAFAIGFGFGSMINYACNNCFGDFGIWIYDRTHTDPDWSKTHYGVRCHAP